MRCLKMHCISACLATGSVKTRNGIARLTKELNAIAADSELSEYVMTHYLLLYAQIRGTVYLLSIRYQRQLSFDLTSH